MTRPRRVGSTSLLTLAGLVLEPCFGAACGGSATIRAPASETSDNKPPAPAETKRPRWVDACKLAFATPQAIYCAVGCVTAPNAANKAFLRDIAIQRARAELARTLATQLEATLRDDQGLDGQGIESTVTQRVAVVLRRSQSSYSWGDGTGTTCALVHTAKEDLVRDH